MRTTETLIGQLTRPTDFSNKHWTRTVPVGGLVEVTPEGMESDSPHVYAYIPGTHYSAVIPKSRIQPA